jgi:hypothetical protein
MTRVLPGNPNLEHLKQEAKSILRKFRDADTSVCETLRLSIKFNNLSDEEILAIRVTLQEVQHALALEYGFETWNDMTSSVEENTNRKDTNMNVVQILANYHHNSGLSIDGRARVSQAASILHQEPESVALISTGADPYSPTDTDHRELITRELASHGIMQDRIIGCLEKTNSTIKEAAKAKEFLAKINFTTLKVVTSDSEYPKAPFIFGHFFPLQKLHFSFVAETNPKDAVLFTRLKDAEIYHQMRAQGGVFVPPDEATIIKTPFSYEEFTDFIRLQTNLLLPLPENDVEVGSQDLNLFRLWEPAHRFGT